jgi:hypothetical protein
VRCATVINIRRVPLPLKPPPYRIPEIQFFQIANAALWLCPPDRDQFWQLIASELRQISEPGEGIVCRVIASAFSRLYRPIEIDPHAEPRHGGSDRYQAKLDAIDANRTRRERSDAGQARRRRSDVR